MNFLLSPAPHIRDNKSVTIIMCVVMLALLPATLGGVYFFGWSAAILVLLSVISAVATELVMNKMMKREVSIMDGSAALTGLLLALCVSPSLPYYQVVFGAIFAIIIGKQLFGGLGFNVFNPALVGRAFLAAAFPVHMTTWANAFAYRGLDAVTQATPLAAMKFSGQGTSYLALFYGNVGGCIGETSVLLLLLGGLYLLYKGIIDWRIPISYLGTVAVLSFVFKADPIFHLLAGGLLLGAFFMATDYVTSPITAKGMWIFGIGAGILVVIIRLFSGLPEGVMYSILFMNAFVPLINRYTRPRILGRKK
ncbi:electron transporter RnfD [Candidatus Saganbacteria bacterium CG08_land_8_20_14_0_20_45_16]|uniref:Ion-translocating oxidoreductase complex subunit D n=1 Tax=Candidatus Saganbacteria bacterium CG08_land_8_20_14_0_20_45_16 TaxID=2014293 RepID=A0A2H0XZY5_UNCSA|nr:MAG: electron transporter RnfD [Candidatus Saganbacteria bacterium CG08_land_8_20_14_0_20_45_16]